MFRFGFLTSSVFLRTTNIAALLATANGHLISSASAYKAVLVVTYSRKGRLGQHRAENCHHGSVQISRLWYVCDYIQARTHVLRDNPLTASCVQDSAPSRDERQDESDTGFSIRGAAKRQNSIESRPAPPRRGRSRSRSPPPVSSRRPYRDLDQPEAARSSRSSRSYYHPRTVNT